METGGIMTITYSGGYGVSPYGVFPYGIGTLVFIPSEFLNPSFEIGTTNIGEAENWVSTSNSAVQVCGFGDYEEPLETFSWYELISSIEGTWCLFNQNIDVQEQFSWGGVFYEVWDTGWVSVVLDDDFVWSVFNDTFTSGTTTTLDNFDWTTFNDIFTGGLECLFDYDVTPPGQPLESFENGW
jgi:hypothetical protein